MADMMRLHPDDVVAHDVIRSAGYNLKSFIDAGLEEYDIAELRKVFE